MRRAFSDSPLYREIAERLEEGVVQDSDAKRHHLVPRFLLREFATSNNGRDSLCQLDKRTGQPLRVTIQAAASRHRFYTLRDDDGVPHNRVEAYLALVEGHAAPAVRRFLEEPELLRATDAATISHHLALLLARTPAGTRRLANAVDTMMRMLMTAEVAEKAAFAGRHAELFGEANAAEVEELRQRMIGGLRDGSIAFPDMKEVGLHYGFRGAAQIAQTIFQMPWTLLRATEGQFVTSDTGVAMVDPHPRYPWTGNGLVSSDYAQTTVPLTPTDCLLLTAGEPTAHRGVTTINSSEVDEVNLRTYGWADRHIFGVSQEAVSGVRAIARRSKRRVPTPRPWRQVILLDADPGDNRLAAEHVSRRWPARFQVEGRAHDYVVVDEQEHPVERSLKVHELVKRRAQGGAQAAGESSLVPIGADTGAVRPGEAERPSRGQTLRRRPQAR